jgi:hypothetical protein
VSAPNDRQLLRGNSPKVEVLWLKAKNIVRIDIDKLQYSLLGVVQPLFLRIAPHDATLEPNERHSPPALRCSVCTLPRSETRINRYAWTCMPSSDAISTILACRLPASVYINSSWCPPSSLKNSCSATRYPANATVAMPRPGKEPLKRLKRVKGPVYRHCSLQTCKYGV